MQEEKKLKEPVELKKDFEEMYYTSEKEVASLQADLQRMTQERDIIAEQLKRLTMLYNLVVGTYIEGRM